MPTPSSRPVDAARPGKLAIAREKLGRVRLGERVLLALSKHPMDVDSTSHYAKPTSAWRGEHALDLLRRACPTIEELVRDRDVVDFGCGDGYQSMALADLGARNVTGVDIAAQRLEHARRLAGDRPGMRFVHRLAPASCDLLVSLDAFEHLADPEGTLGAMVAAVRPGGHIVLSFGPPWFSPYGAHMWFFTEAPWMHLLFSERTVMRVRSLYRDDGRTRYEDGLNRLSIRRFEAMLARSGARVQRLELRSPGVTRPLTKVPLLRELFINHVDAVLAVP